jgi:hypothetical protein
VRQLIDARHHDLSSRLNVVYVAEIGIAETAAAIAILARTGRIHLNLRDRIYRKFQKDLLNEYQIIHVTRAHIDTAADLTQRYPLKGYDAVQLAVALDVNQILKRQVSPLIFVTADRALLQAAQAEGLSTDNPFDHTDLDRPTKQ